ncbi:hypothetical protein [Rhizobium halophytocola]|uniref:Phage-related protein n=1 Tax=Rhizobium halophytocola TaxID=735519 RepID=A0ABS4DVI8_9HYPH|nr:hypothetical protein [Rhizobium halophytocola]MBP1849697.1 phage-related protein [Rhizobium halophytocola]
MAGNAVIGALRVVLGLDTSAFEDGSKSASASVAKLGKGLQKAGVSLSTYLTAPLAAAGAGLAAAMKGVAEGVQETVKQAQVSNAGFETFQRLAYAAKSVGVESDKLADIFKDVNERVGEFSQTGGGAMKDFFDNIAPKVGLAANAFKDLSGPQALQLYYDSLKKAGASQQEMTFYLEALSSDATQLIPLLENSGEGFRKLGEGAAVITEDKASGLKAYNDAMRQLSEAVKGVAIALATSGLIDFVTQVATKASEWIAMLSQTNPEILKWGTVVAGLTAALGPVVVGLGLAVSAIAAIGLPVAAAIAGVAALTAAVIAFWPEIQQAGTVVADFVSGAWASFVSAWDGMVEKLGRVSTAVKEFSRDIYQAFADLPGKMLEIGGQIIEGLWNGIKAKWDSVKSGVSNIAGSITSSIKSTLGIHSPSQVMHEVGVNVMQGLQNGMDSLQGNVVASATTTAEGVRGAFSGLKDVGSDVGQGIQDAFEGIGSSIAGVIDGTKTWRDVALDALKSITQNLLSSANFGGGAFGGIFKGLLGGLFGFANGGSFNVGGAGGVDSQIVAFKASPKENVSITKPGQEAASHSGGIAGIRVYVDEDGNWRAAVQNEAYGVAQRVTKAGIQKYDSGLAGRMQQVTERNG